MHIHEGLPVAVDDTAAPQADMEDNMENNIWKTLYERAKAVQCERQLSPLMEVGSVGAAVLTEKGNIYTGICIDTACGMGMCAERNAIANMLTNGECKITKVVAPFLKAF